MGLFKRRVAASYPANRLLFKADVIEKLRDGDRFRIETPKAVFEMSKRDFYRVFANVARSASYRDKGVYHYPTIPEKANEFVVRK